MQLKIDMLILAGGKSSRMGTDKGLVKLAGITFTQHILDKFSRYADHVYISSANTEYACYGHELIPDSVPSCGPLSGIISGLEHAKSEWVLIVSCDLPLVDLRFYNVLINTADKINYDVCVFANQSVFQPLFGLYRKSCLSYFKTQFNAGHYSVTSCIKSLRLLEVDPLEHGLPIEYLNSINSIEELNRIKKNLV